VLLDSTGCERVGETVHESFSLPLEDFRVQQCRIDHAFSLELDSPRRAEASWSIRLEGEFFLTDSEGASRTLGQDDAPPGGYGEAVDILLWKTVTAAKVDADGTLRLRFDGETAVVVPDHARYESWTVHGSGGELIVSGPGGQVSRWGAEHDLG
jgi:hypothetical protein